jgi:hypothetical protein
MRQKRVKMMKTGVKKKEAGEKVMFQRTQPQLTGQTGTGIYWGCC